MKKTVAIAMGGYTSECDVSLQSGKNVYDQLKDVYEVYQAHILKEDWYVWFDDQKYPIDKSDFSALIKGKKVGKKSRLILCLIPYMDHLVKTVSFKAI
jgi:D-alanine-D-alanine ligase